MSFATRVRAAVGILVCFGILSGFSLTRKAFWELHDETIGQDPMTRFAARLEFIRRDLPANGVVGYVTDPPNDIGQELIWTRYYLAPLIVLPSTQQNLVIGNFHNPVPAEMLSERHLVLTKDYGDGIQLFTNRQP